MPKTQRKQALHPSLFDPIPNRPQWEKLAPRIGQQLLPLLLQLLSSHAVRNPGRAERGGRGE
jgi:hypothetical protein